MSIEEWLIFVAIWTAATLPLGPNALNCIAAAADHGFSRALWAVVGILVAALCHIAATVMGTAAILLANAALFQALKLAGATYLVWMGVSLWRRRDAGFAVKYRPPASRLRLVRQGFLISMSNPKAVFSYLAVFTQFLKPGVPLDAQLIILVPTALVPIAAVYAGYAALGLGIARLLASARRRLSFNRGVGSAYILAGIGLAVAEPGTAGGAKP
ncbi:MAG: LysE family transporter [Alphaproteobacteria bacterium]|nr:LysE family transporter [Alphaproteobacteria bacterium]